ncbi:MAG TPA: hypothetical protein VKE51_20035 [Vicinamibacterales bacterium]|nr:hypothetical protein [Vicinamibacterales bacterium]
MALNPGGRPLTRAAGTPRCSYSNATVPRPGILSIGHGINATLFVDQSPQLVEETLATGDMIPMNGTAPLLGRIVTADDDKPGAPKDDSAHLRIMAARVRRRSERLGASLRAAGGWRLAGIGLVAGVGAALLSTRVMRSSCSRPVERIRSHSW